MRRKNTGSSHLIARLEQVAVFAASLVWTAVILLIIGLIWAHHDAQARWETVRSQRAPTPVALKSLNIITPAGDSLSFATAPMLTPSPTVMPARTSLPTPAAPEPSSQLPELLPETPAEDQPGSLSLAGQQPPVAATALPTDVPSPTATISPLLLPAATPSGQAPAIATPVPPPPAAEGPTRLVIESVGIDTPVIPVGSSIGEENGQRYVVWDVADYAAGWHNTSAPLGQPGNTVLAGHNNIKGEVFRYLVDVEEGDAVDLYVGETVYRYYVEQKLLLKDKGEPLEVRLRNAQWIAPTEDVRVTLVTCWPYTSNTHRVIVVAKPRPL
jgi:sortase A